ncbi:Coenzyme F420 hydrogenase/dehydrogenase, beta subunit C-terminal domain, partial [Stenotrophomonas maltophilia group sp. RNC7]|uniref:Coenzyme F420 hydrogenase/dehydrogenase, beta subunit C-terminal domain n=1 Tax=Stenotrophomonas maltophilia group sp. RNC7 TaxID=3071467 RepID=UPI0027E1F3CA
KKNAEEPVAYAAWNKNQKILDESSSGGVFGVFAKYVLEKEGLVFGATYSEDLSVNHISIHSMEELILLQGSKYVQSNIGETFKLVKQALINDKYVLFSGTPCQVAGLYGYLGGDNFEKLLTCDLVCHGVPSPGVFRSYINYLEDKEKAKLTKIKMRTKERGWTPLSDMKYEFDNFKEYEQENALKDPYMNGFLYSLYLRKSCYNCKYAKTPRESDVTIADFWGIGNEIPFNHSIEQGISLVLTNSNKGK